MRQRVTIAIASPRNRAADRRRADHRARRDHAAAILGCSTSCAGSGTGAAVRHPRPRLVAGPCARTADDVRGHRRRGRADRDGHVGAAPPVHARRCSTRLRLRRAAQPAAGDPRPAAAAVELPPAARSRPVARSPRRAAARSSHRRRRSGGGRSPAGSRWNRGGGMSADARAARAPRLSRVFRRQRGPRGLRRPRRAAGDGRRLARGAAGIATGIAAAAAASRRSPGRAPARPADERRRSSRARPRPRSIGAGSPATAAASGGLPGRDRVARTRACASATSSPSRCEAQRLATQEADRRVGGCSPGRPPGGVPSAPSRIS